MKILAAFFLVIVLVVAGWFMFSSKLPEADFIIISGAEVDTLDPQQASWLTDFRVIECLYEPLVGVSTVTLKLEPAVASKWEISEDKLSYTFHIRPEAKWSNGDPVTAHDYIYAWQRAMLPDHNTQYATMHMHIKGAKAFHEKRKADLKSYSTGSSRTLEAATALLKQTMADFDATVGLKATDDRTLVVTLERPTPYFLDLVAFNTYAPVHRKSVEAATKLDPEGQLVMDAKYFSDPSRAVTNGAYVLAQRNFKEYTLLTANPNYWDKANMGNQSILVRVIENENTQLLEYNAGNAHWLPDIPTTSPLAADLVEQQKKGDRKDVHVELGAGTYFYHFNCNKEYKGKPNVLSDPRVRKALSMAIDRKTIVEKITRLNQPVALTMTPLNVGVGGYEPPAEEAGVKFDPDGAKKLLAEAGFPDGKGFPQDMKISYNTGSRHEVVAQQIQQDWEKILGIKVALEGAEKSQIMEIRRKHDFTITRGGWYGDYPDPTTFLEQFLTGDGHNTSAYSNAKYDELYHKAAEEPDVVKRLALLREAEAILLNEQPIAPIYQYVHINIYDKAKVENLNTNPWNYRQLHAVKVKKN